MNFGFVPNSLGSMEMAFQRAKNKQKRNKLKNESLNKFYEIMQFIVDEGSRSEHLRYKDRAKIRSSSLKVIKPLD